VIRGTRGTRGRRAIAPAYAERVSGRGTRGGSHWETREVRLSPLFAAHASVAAASDFDQTLPARAAAARKAAAMGMSGNAPANAARATAAAEM